MVIGKRGTFQISVGFIYYSGVLKKWKKQMRVLHVLNDSVPLVGGYTSRAKCIVSHQKKCEMEPFVVTSLRQGLTNSSIERIDGIQYFRTNWPEKSRSKGNPLIGLMMEIALFYKKIVEVVKIVKPDVIHAHSPILCAIPGMLAAKMRRLPFVYEIRAFWEDAAVASGKFSEISLKYRAIRTLETYICKHADRVVTISHAMRNDLILRNIPNERVFVVPNGFDAEALRRRPKESSLVSRLGLKGKVVLGYIGQFYGFEGIDDLIRAFTILRGNEKDVALLLIGGGEEEKSIREQVARLGDSAVILIEKVAHEKVADYYALMDIMIYPRKKNRLTELTTPLKPLEAMALGKPVICSSVGGLIELVGANNGLFFSPGNQDALIDCCMQLLRKQTLRKELVENGKKRALTERSWTKIVKEYYRVYDFV